MKRPEAKRNRLMLLFGLPILAVTSLVLWPFGQARPRADEPARRWELRWWNRHRELRHLAAEGGHRLVFVGDSITQNWEGTGREVWDEYYQGRAALNLGISSDKTQHILWRLKNIEFGVPLPDAFVLLAGTNNSADYTAEETAVGVRAIVSTLREIAPESKVLLLAILPRGATLNDPKRKVNEAANRLISDIADDEHVYFVDINHKFVSADGSTDLALLPDALHPNRSGYATLAKALEPTISSLLDKDSENLPRDTR